MHIGRQKLIYGNAWREFELLYSDLEESFRYIQPVKENFNVYSLRFYELLLRAATEFENICKSEIVRNRLSNKKTDELKINDFYILENHLKSISNNGGPIRQLIKWEVGFYFDPIIYRQPLKEWKRNATIPWYKEYNKVKHNRKLDFSKANLGNVLDGIASVFILLMNLDYSWTSREWLGNKIYKPDGSIIYFDTDWPVCAKIHYFDLLSSQPSKAFIDQAIEDEKNEPWRKIY